MTTTPTYDSFTDERDALKQFAATGDPEAFAYITARYQSMVFGTCHRILKSSADAEDAAQETFLRLARHASSVRSNIGAWLHATAMGCSIDLVRKAGAIRRAEQQAASSEQANTQSPADSLSWSEIEPVLDEALAALDESDRDLLVARYLCAFSQREIASQLGINEGTVSRRMNAALDKLRAQFKANGINIATGAMLVGALSALPMLKIPAGLTSAIAKVPLFHAASGSLTQAASTGSSAFVKVAAAGIGVVLTGTLIFAMTRPSAAPQPTVPIQTAVAIAVPQTDDAAPDRPTGKIGPFQIVSAGERNFFDRGVWIRDKRLSINHGIDPESRQVISSSLEILAREKDDDGIILLTRVREIMPVGLKYSRFERGGLVDIHVSFDEYNRIVLQPLTEGIQLGANEPRWFGVRPPAGWEEHGRVPDDPGEDGLLGPWTEAERIPVTISSREILFGTDNWQAAIYRIVNWEKTNGYARVESIHAGGRNPYLIGTRFRLIIRKEDEGYTIAYFPPTKDRSNRWPSSFEYSPENPVTVVTIKDLP